MRSGTPSSGWGGWLLGEARLVQALFMGGPCLGLDALVGAWQGRHVFGRVEGKAVGSLALIEAVVEILQLRCHEAPVIQRPLQGAGDVAGHDGMFQVAGDDDQLAVTGFILAGGEFHGIDGVRGPMGVAGRGNCPVLWRRIGGGAAPVGCCILLHGCLKLPDSMRLMGRKRYPCRVQRVPCTLVRDVAHPVFSLTLHIGAGV